MHQIAVMLIDVRSALNVGAIFRTLDAVGGVHMYLCGVTPDPVDRFGRPVTAITKTALGAEKNIAWEHVADPLACISVLRHQGWRVVAVEQDVRAIDYKTCTPDTPTLVVFGSEVGGLSKDVLDVVDIVLEIPMRGKKESLNVSVAAGVVLYRLTDL